MSDGIQHLLAMAVGGIDDDDVAAGVDQTLGALHAVVTGGDGGGHTQTALGILGGMRVEL